ncbi:hypothetical protein LCGC14_1918200 [marine sediment metagenome]|uniref:Tyr recombinase domain-containing protein n=1 Tax=marine sediment metagenome TaxID=412755 RepID=A0A0F9GEW5_9ZZZZ
MSIRQKPDGRWLAVWYVNGKQKAKEYGRGEIARQKAIAKDAAMRATRPRRRDKGGATFDQLANLYLETKKGTIAETSIYNMYRKFDAVIGPVIGHVAASLIDARTIDAYVSSRISEVKKSTINRDIADIQAVLNWAVSRNYLSRNPIAGLKKPARDDEIIDPPTIGELSRILDHLEGHVKRAIYIQYYTGVRPGFRELFSLRYQDVNRERGTITIRSARKGGIAVRRIPLHPDLAILLDRWYAADGKEADRYIIRYNDRPIKSYKTAWKQAKKAAGITRRIRPYDLRHAAISELVRLGDLRAAGAIAGHSAEEMTIKYTHTNLDAERGLIERMPSLVNKKPENVDQ